MISLRGSELPTNDQGDSLYWVNIGRPDILETTIDAEREFHDWVRDTDIEIVVSDAFAYLSTCIAETQYYLGGGFKYMFWFFSQEDKDTFIKYLESKGRGYEA